MFLFQVIGPAVFSLDLLETVRDPGCGVCALLFGFCGVFGFWVFFGWLISVLFISCLCFVTVLFL